MTELREFLLAHGLFGVDEFMAFRVRPAPYEDAYLDESDRSRCRRYVEDAYSHYKKGKCPASEVTRVYTSFFPKKLLPKPQPVLPRAVQAALGILIMTGSDASVRVAVALLEEAHPRVATKLRELTRANPAVRRAAAARMVSLVGITPDDACDAARRPWLLHDHHDLLVMYSGDQAAIDVLAGVTVVIPSC